MYKFTGKIFTKLFYKKKKKEVKLNSIHLVVQITDENVFNELFPDNGNAPKVQPSWEYFDKKRVIKIDLGTDITNFLNKNDSFEYSLNTFFELKENDEYLIDIDIETFKKFGDIFVYINYNLDNNEYINVYSKNEIIFSKHFLIKNKINLNLI